MMTILNEEVVLAALFPAVLAITQVIFTTRRQYYAYAKSLCIRYISRMLILPQEPSDKQIRKLRLRFSTEIILDASIFVSQHIYGNMLYRLSSIVEVCEIDQYLLRSTGRSISRTTRLKSLSKLSQLCSSTAIVEQSEALLNEEEQSMRTYATAALVMARPERAIRYVARLTHRLSLHNVAMLSQLMRRAGAPIAYTPLLASQSQNLQLIGLYLCEHFSIVDAEPLMQKLCIAEDGEVALAALYAICSIRGDITTSQVDRAAMRLSSSQRESLIRHLVNSCYSLRSCAHLLTREEQRLFRERLNSYKCQIICN